jgi:beta-carotene 3-hydroxylase
MVSAQDWAYDGGMKLVVSLLLFVTTVVGMEVFAWAMHRYVMHGFLWSWHRSHHEPHDHVLEKNDLFALVFALPAMGLGVTAYGLIYGWFHDGLVHRRYPTGLSGRSAFWRKRIQAHRLHHAVHTKTGGVSFGFLWVQPARVLKAELVQKRTASSSGA